MLPSGFMLAHEFIAELRWKTDVSRHYQRYVIPNTAMFFSDGASSFTLVLRKLHSYGVGHSYFPIPDSRCWLLTYKAL